MTSLPTTQAIWAELSADLRRFIRRRVADEHTADDLLQETFIRIHRHIDSLQQADRLAAWVYRIASNVIHDHYRQSGAGVVELGDLDPAEPAEGPLDQYRGHAQTWMDELIQQLPEPYQEAVRLTEIEGLTQQQLADRLGMTLSGAKSRVQRGRAKLKDVLDQCCTFGFDRRGNLVDCDPRPDRTVCRQCGDLDSVG